MAKPAPWNTFLLRSKIYLTHFTGKRTGAGQVHTQLVSSDQHPALFTAHSSPGNVSWPTPGVEACGPQLCSQARVTCHLPSALMPRARLAGGSWDSGQEDLRVVNELLSSPASAPLVTLSR